MKESRHTKVRHITHINELYHASNHRYAPQFQNLASSLGYIVYACTVDDAQGLQLLPAARPCAGFFCFCRAAVYYEDCRFFHLCVLVSLHIYAGFFLRIFKSHSRQCTKPPASTSYSPLRKFFLDLLFGCGIQQKFGCWIFHLYVLVYLRIYVMGWLRLVGSLKL